MGYTYPTVLIFGYVKKLGFNGFNHLFFWVPIFSDKPKSVLKGGPNLCYLDRGKWWWTIAFEYGSSYFLDTYGDFFFCFSQGISSILKGLIIEMDVKWWPLLSLVNLPGDQHLELAWVATSGFALYGPVWKQRIATKSHFHRGNYDLFSDQPMVCRM